jgi:hypothetical protein
MFRHLSPKDISTHIPPSRIPETHSINTPPIRRNDRMPRSVFCARALYLLHELERSVGLQLVDPDCVCTAARRQLGFRRNGRERSVQVGDVGSSVGIEFNPMGSVSLDSIS